MCGCIRRWRRRRLAKRPFPEAWRAHLERQVPYYGRLAPDQRERYETLVKTFVWEKHFFGAGGLEPTDEMRVVIAACAARLVLYLDLSYYDELTEIVIYPSAYRHPDSDAGEAVLGEAHTWGLVVLSWDSVLRGLANPHDGHDTAAHEFAHVLDIANGSFDGTPQLRRGEHYRPWATVLGEHYNGLQRRRRKERTVLRDYGATNEAEFFAVATESYFEKPVQMKRQTPQLYAEMQRFYGGDPAASDAAGEAADESRAEHPHAT